MAAFFYHFQEIYKIPSETMQFSTFLNETCPEPVIVIEEPTEPPISVVYLPVSGSNVVSNKTSSIHPDTTFLKDFGMFAKNRKSLLIILICRI